MLRIHSLPACFVRRAHAWGCFKKPVASWALKLRPEKWLTGKPVSHEGKA